jgi:hypothetical protein
MSRLKLKRLPSDSLRFVNYVYVILQGNRVPGFLVLRTSSEPCVIDIGRIYLRDEWPVVRHQVTKKVGPS